MPSHQLTDREWLYIVALIWNLATIAYFFWSSGRKDSSRRRVLEELQARFPFIRKALQTVQPASPVDGLPEREKLERIIHFSRNPRAFNYTLPETSGESEPLLEKVERMLAAVSANEKTTVTADAPSPAASAVDATTLTASLEKADEDLARLVADRKAGKILTVGVLGNWVILILMIISHFQLRASF